MSRDIVTKTNTLIQASYSLSVNEIKLIALAIVDSRESGLGLNATSHLTITAQRFAEKFGIESKFAYDILKNAANTLFERQASYDDVDPATGKTRKNKTRWVQKVSYVEGAGAVQFVFAADVLPMITYIDGRIDGYTTYFLDEISGLKSAYAIRLFELLMQWKHTLKTPLISIEKFRELVGVSAGEYASSMVNFKRRVLDLAVNQINENTDFTVEYEQHKTGVKVTGFVFKFKAKKPAIEEKKKPKPNKPQEIEITDDFVSKHALPGESWEQARTRLKNEAKTGKFSLSPTD